MLLQHCATTLVPPVVHTQQFFRNTKHQQPMKPTRSRLVSKAHQDRKEQHHHKCDKFLHTSMLEIKETMRFKLLHPLKLKHALLQHWPNVQKVYISDDKGKVMLHVVCAGLSSHHDRTLQQRQRELDESVQHIAHILNELNLGEYILGVIDVWVQYMELDEIQGDVIPLSIESPRYCEFYL